MAEESSSNYGIWDPVGQLDYALFAVAAMHEAFVAATVIHLLWCRSWPPYVVKNVSLVCVTGIAGLMSLVGVVITFGFVQYDSPTLLSNCFFQGVISFTGIGLYYCAAVVRVYRNYMVLIRHSVNMWRPVIQILILQAPIWAAATALLFPSVTRMDYAVNRCTGSACYVHLGVYNYAGLMLLAAIYLMWKMRNVRKQMNEYRVMMFSLGFLMLAVVVYDATARGLSSRHTLIRRLALASNTVCSALLFWPVIVTPLWKYFRKDAAYAETFTLGLAPAVAPAMLRGSLADQLKVDELWAHFRKIAEERMSPSLPAFFKACMDRDREEGFFERQAKTMDIIGTYVIENAPSKVDLSEECRVRILASEVSRYNIFEEASAEVLRRMQETCEEAFKRSEALGSLMSKAERDEAELEALRKAKLLPKAFHSTAEAAHGLRSSPDAWRSDRWTGSTLTESDAATRTSFFGFWRERFLGSVRTVRDKKDAPQRLRRQRQCAASNARANLGSTAAAPPASQQSIIRQKERILDGMDLEDPRAFGINSPLEAVGWGGKPGSPLPWVTAQEGMEAGNASSYEEGNTRTPSTLSTRRDSSMFASKTPNFPGTAIPVPSLSEAHGSSGSFAATPSPLRKRPLVPAPPPPNRAPPAPWISWRRSAELPVAPAPPSPPLYAVSDVAVKKRDRFSAQGDLVAPAKGEMPLASPRRPGAKSGDEEVGPLSSKVEVPPGQSSSLVVFVLPPSPPSPASPPASSRPDSPNAASQRFHQHLESMKQRLTGEAGFGKHEVVSSLDSDSPVLGCGVGHGNEDGGDARKQGEQLASQRTGGGEARPQDEHSRNSEGGCEAGAVVVTPSKDDCRDASNPLAHAVQPWFASSPGSCSECSEKRASGATCWSSGVGGGGAMIQEALATGADPPLSSPHPSAVSSPSPEMLSRSPFRPQFAGPGVGFSEYVGDAPTIDAPSPPLTGSPLLGMSMSHPPPSPVQFRRSPSPVPLLPCPSPRSSGSISSSPQGVDLASDGASGDTLYLFDVEMGMVDGGVLGATGFPDTIEVHAPSEMSEISGMPIMQPPTGPVPSPPAKQSREEHLSLPVEAGGCAGDDRPRKCAQEGPGSGATGADPKGRAPRNRTAASSHAGAVGWVPQPLKPAHPPKGTQPARALPARAPTRGETLSFSPPRIPSLSGGFGPLYRSTPSGETPLLQHSDFSPPPAVTPMPLMLELVAAPTFSLAPPSPAGRSASVSPSSVRSSPRMMPRLAQVQGGLPPPPPARDGVASGSGVPFLLSWSDSTLSGSVSDGRGGGASSVCASISPDPSSPLVGIRFLAPGGMPSAEVTGRVEADRDHASDPRDARVLATGKADEEVEFRGGSRACAGTGGLVAAARGEAARGVGTDQRANVLAEGRRQRRYFFP